MTYWAEDAPHYVYSLRGATGATLYVGCTADLPRRLREHGRKEWWPEVESLSAQVYPSANDGYAAEAALIRETQPLHNSLMTDGPRAAKAQPCRRCRTGRHRSCCATNSRGEPCPCSVCADALAWST